MSNPENNWVHISLKIEGGALLDVRAEDGDTLRALVDGATTNGVYDAAVAGFDPGTKAVETVKKTFGKTTEQPAKSGGFGNKGKQQAPDDDRFLGKHDGYGITVKNGKFGYYFNAYNSESKDRVNVNLPKGADPAVVTLQDAVDALSAA
jgi:hypothetical protein